MTSSQRKRNKSSQGQRKLQAASLTLNAILLVALAFTVLNVNHTQSSKPATDGETPVQAKAPNDEGAFKEAFTANCVIQAKVNLGKTTANTYCNCVLDRGIEMYGVEGFIKINQQITKTYDMSELKDTIDGCAAKATARGNK
jgi:hypothetical protein